MASKILRAVLIILLLFFGIFCFAKNSQAATYYIDYNAADDSANGMTKSTPWKRCPGMYGFAGSYSHSPGDIFVFKGGVTWPAAVLPLTIGYSGTAGHIDTYTVDQTWYTGGSYSYPVFDGNMAVAEGIMSQGKSYLLINGLKILNTGSAITGTGWALFMGGGSYIEVSNCWLAPNAIEAFSYSTGGANQSHIYFHHNHIENAGRWVIYGGTGYVLDDVRVYNNTMSGPGMTFGTYHQDGLMIGNADTTACRNSGVATVTNLLFYNNKFYGDWSARATAMLYSNGCVNNVTVYNNVFAIEDSTGSVNLSPAFVSFGANHDSNIYVYNNAFSSDSYPGKDKGAVAALNLGDATGTLIVNGNIFSGFGIDIIGGGGTRTFDYNLHNISLAGTPGYGDLIWSGGTRCKSLSECKAAGYETHGLTGDPKYVAIPNGTTGSGDWHLQLTSPAIDAGTALSAYFTTDLDGTTRPVGAAWDIGAYEYVSGSLQTCSQLSGSCCSSGQVCSGTVQSASDCSACCTGGTCSSQYFLPGQYVEAESGILVSPMQSGTNASASGGQYIYTATSNQGSASYTFQISAPGRYRMEARVLTPDPIPDGHNSFYLGLDGEPAQGNDNYTFDTLETTTFAWDSVRLRGPLGNFSWSQYDPMLWDLTQGTHTFTFYGRESNTWLDQIILRTTQAHKSDTSQDGCVQSTELNAFISLWYLDSSNPTLRELIEAIGLWKRGGC